MDSTLVIQREKDNTVFIRSIPAGSIINSYTVLELTADEFNKFLSLGSWQNIQELGKLCLKGIFANDIKAYFFELAKAKVKDRKIDYTKKIISKVPGTSCLVRSSDKSKIWIARRKEGATQNETRINRVCISNGIRENFFDDIRYCNLGRYYILKDDAIFKEWADFMDNEYQRQLDDKD